MIDVGPFAGAELQVTALTFSACPPTPEGIINSLVAILEPFSAVSADVIFMQSRNLKEDWMCQAVKWADIWLCTSQISQGAR